MLNLVSLILLVAIPGPYGRNSNDEYTEFSLEELLQMEITIASGIEESLTSAPAAIVVITAEDIRQRGYTDLTEIVADLPGFDVTVSNGAAYSAVYQRGYRTPFTQRTLLMINGQVDNHLWSHAANLSRQYPIANVERIEVLYGPASAVYGPNAFLGIINVITRDGKDVADGKTRSDIHLGGGTFNTRMADVAFAGKRGDLSFAISGRIFQSDEPDFSDRWGFLSNDLYSNRNIYGPLLDLEVHNRKLGEYYDPTDNYGLIGTVDYRGLRLGYIDWVRKEGYGPDWSADRAQNNSFWNNSSRQLYLEYHKDYSETIKLNTLLLQRHNRIWGDWAEALPDWDEDPGLPIEETHSYISFTGWNSQNNSWLVKQNFEWRVADTLFLSGGLKYERKELTKAYDVSGYWGAFSSSVPADEPGPHGHGAGIGHSTDETYTPPPPPLEEMPSLNLALTRDMGGFLQAIIDRDRWRFNLGIRYDDNSIYGESVNPRVSAVYKFNAAGAIKFLYGEAFQEPAPVQLWGGWSGRAANPNLEPEEVSNYEVIFMTRAGSFLHDVSGFYSEYKNVIKEEAENAGNRDVWGLEYRGRGQFRSPLKKDDIKLSLNATYTDTTSSIHYNHQEGAWLDGETELGDIAPLKVNLAVNVPLAKKVSINLRTNHVAARTLYTRNPLRDQGIEADAYTILHGTLNLSAGPALLSIKCTNLLDKDYMHPGREGAEGGNNFEHRSLGFHNSLMPQPGRAILANLKINF